MAIIAREVAGVFRAKIKKPNMANVSALITIIVLVIFVFLIVFIQIYGFLVINILNHHQMVQCMAILLCATRSCFARKRRRACFAKRNNKKRRSTWRQNGRTESWWAKLLSNEMPLDTWKKNFRMSREEFKKLADELRPFISPDLSSPNYMALSAEKKLAMTLYFLKDTGSMAMTANTFGVALCTVSRHVVQVSYAIAKHLGPKYIHLPMSKDEMRQKSAEFEAKFGMPQAFGCIDGTHVRIKRPVCNSQEYFNYKQFYSLSVQAVCDFQGRFMDVDCRWPGSVHDAKVFANSSINRKLSNGLLPVTYKRLVPGHAEIPNYLIGDPAYPLLPYCMKEYQTCTTNQEVLFNNLLRSARNPIECSFGRLKARWSVLSKQIDVKLENVPVIIYSCFVLHNYCEQNKTGIDHSLVEKQISLKKVQENGNPLAKYSSNEGEGGVVRTVLTTYIKLNLPDHLVTD